MGTVTEKIAAILGKAPVVVDTELKAQRLAGSREGLKSQIADSYLAGERAKELLDEIAAVDRDVDDEVERHAAAALVIQGELDAIHEQRKAAVVAGVPMDATIEARRKALLGQLDDLNKTLALVVAAADDRKAKLASQREVERGKAGAVIALRNQLAQMVPQDSVNAAYVSECRMNWANARWEAAKKLAEANQSRLDRIDEFPADDQEVIRARKHKYEAEYQAASEERGAARRAQDDAYKSRLAE